MLAAPVTMMRCERCRAVVSSVDALAMIQAGTPCGVCGGTLTRGVPDPPRDAYALAQSRGHGVTSERRFLRSRLLQ
ncbi:MAG: hypothetical protein QOG15_1664 [Solirubrobacteraceae bacterium]|jgi:hypothetical protein|nr:hypothetical protein [Solirubrobacteraceae bacterium]